MSIRATAAALVICLTGTCFPAVTTSSTLTPVPFNQVTLTGGFWAGHLERNRTISLPHSLAMLEKAGNIANLKLAAAGGHTGYMGPLFIDSDLYKALEAISCSLASHPDPALEKRLDEIITLIAAAQRPDGYLNTFIQVNKPDQRFSNLRDEHELYCAGHLMEAAVAHFRATGKRTFLDVAIRLADYIDQQFRTKPDPIKGYPGHQEIELALFKLADVTGEDRYRTLSRLFLDRRGNAYFAHEHNTPPDKYNGDHWQDNTPLRNHKRMVGHAVRATYMFSAATDYAAQTSDLGLLSMLDTVWDNTVNANMYVTGGIGSSAVNEGFTRDFDLPNDSAYQETCASVGMILWNHRMAMLHGQARYADIMERSLYNGFLAGVSLDAKKFFYVNPLASAGKHHRTEWYSCACCPPNVTRTLAQLGGYAYATSPDSLWVNLYLQGSVSASVSSHPLTMNVTTNYPWEGDIRMTLETSAPLTAALRLHVPDWCDDPAVAVNGTTVTAPLTDGYLVLQRDWNSGDAVHLHLPMPVRLISADPRVTADRGQVAIQRGPLVYCIEQADNSAPVPELTLDPAAHFSPHHQPDLLGGVTVITGAGTRQQLKPADLSTSLYATAKSTSTTLTAIPYYAWDNRQPGAMAVWLPLSPSH